MSGFVHFLPVVAVQKLLKSVKIWQSCCQMFTATLYEPRQKCRFWFFQVRCAHKLGDVINFNIVACRISSRLKWYKKYKNRLRLGKVIVQNKVSRFYGSLCDWKYEISNTAMTSEAGRHWLNIKVFMWKTVV